MGLLSKILGSDKAMVEGARAVRDGLDALVYTDEEKSADAMRERAAARAMVIKWMQATQGQNLARRLLALSITAVWLLDIVLGQIAGALAIFIDGSTGEQIDQLGKFMVASALSMSDAVMLILAFYFAAPHMSDIAKAVVGKYSSKAPKG